MNNPLKIVVENLRYSISSTLDDTAFSKDEMPFTMPFTMPGTEQNDIKINISVSVLKYNITTELTEPSRTGIQYMIIGSTFIIG